MTPYINNPAFVRALQDIGNAIEAEPVDQASADYVTSLGQFLGGIGAMCAWWGDVGKTPQTNDTLVSREKMSFSILPGSPDVYNNEHGEWETAWRGPAQFCAERGLHRLGTLRYAEG